MIRKYLNHKMQTNQGHREEEQHNNHETHEDVLTKETSSSLPIKMIAKPEWTQSKHNKTQNNYRTRQREQPNFPCLLRLL